MSLSLHLILFSKQALVYSKHFLIFIHKKTMFLSLRDKNMVFYLIIQNTIFCLFRCLLQLDRFLSGQDTVDIEQNH